MGSSVKHQGLILLVISLLAVAIIRIVETGDSRKYPSLFILDQGNDVSGGKSKGPSFASYYGSHMVLQQAPKAAILWGYTTVEDIGRKVKVTLRQNNGSVIQSFSTVAEKEPGLKGQGVWKGQLKPRPAGGPYTITVSSKQGQAAITDVLFGDVWLCSGQSNMQFALHKLKPEDLAAETERLSLYPAVRIFTAAPHTSPTPLLDLQSVHLPWTRVGNETLKPWTDFSAVCWLYGRRLSEILGYPIGLIETDWGGTAIEVWSSPDALHTCYASSAEDEVEAYRKVENATATPRKPSVLWNAMIHPFLNFTIYGAIWYQGESNKGKNNYNCTFPSMVRDWRAKFHQGSLGQTSSQFPFGFVQLAPDRNNASIEDGFPSIRWQQTANLGYTPNERLPNVFMAVAMDLPDFKSPWGSIHPRDKETVAARLLLSALVVSYGRSDIKFQGPRPSAFLYSYSRGNDITQIQIEFDQRKTLLVIQNTEGFEICCSKENTTYCHDSSSDWVSVLIVSHDGESVTISTTPCLGAWIMGIRYNWRESPCPYKRCAVYSAENQLPAPPMVVRGIFGNDGEPVPDLGMGKMGSWAKKGQVYKWRKQGLLVSFFNGS